MENKPNDELKEFYEKSYDRTTEIFQIPQDDDLMYAQVLSQIRPYLTPGMKVLDLGCNNGILSLYMANLGCEVLGIDLANNAIKSANRNKDYHNLNNAEFKSMDFISDWKEEEVFDLILCSHVIEHIPQDDEFIKKIFLSLKKEGKLILLTPADYSSLVLISKLITGKFAHDEEVGHLRRYTKKNIRNLIENEGFIIDNITFLDGAFRDWVFLFKPLRFLQPLLSIRYLRNIFNNMDFLLANSYFFPATICVNALRND
jgi:2-polyprenyl-3-methyl-5-hydroxy-6-metoxy-1,4-benzoquinol methylase